MKKISNLYRMVQVVLPLRQKLKYSLSVLALSSSFAYGSTNQEQLIDLEEKQAELKEKINRTEIISQTHGKYTLVRDTYYYGDQGVISKSTYWNDQVSQWLVDWKTLLGIMEQVRDLSNANVQENIKSELFRLGREFNSIKKLSSEIKTRNDNAIYSLDSLEKVPSSWVKHYENHIDLLNSQIQNLKLSFLSSKGTYENNESWKEVLSLTDEAVTLLLKKSLLRYPDLAQAVQRVTELFEAERLIQPLVYNVNNLHDTIRNHILAKRIFHADKLITNLRSLVDQSKREIRSTEIDAEFTREAIEEIEKRLNSIERLRGNLNAFTKGQLVAANFTNEGRIIASKCRDSEERKNYNCELFRRVFSIPANKIPSLNDLELETIENNIEQIKKGPIGGLK